MDLIEVARQCPDLTVSIRLGDLIEANQSLVEEALMRLEKSVAESRVEIYLSRTKVMEMLEVASATLWRWWGMTRKPFVHPLRDSLTPADLRLRPLLGAFRTSGAVPSGLLATHIKVVPGGSDDLTVILSRESNLCFARPRHFCGGPLSQRGL